MTDNTLRDKVATYLLGTSGDRHDIADLILRDFIVIPRADLPKVKTDGGVFADSIGWQKRDITDDLPQRARLYAMQYLAIAEYLDAHPPVDEAQVDALAALINEPGDETTADLARRLIASGRVTVKEA